MCGKFECVFGCENLVQREEADFADPTVTVARLGDERLTPDEEFRSALAADAEDAFEDAEDELDDATAAAAAAAAAALHSSGSAPAPRPIAHPTQPVRHACARRESPG